MCRPLHRLRHGGACLLLSTPTYPPLGRSAVENNRLEAYPTIYSQGFRDKYVMSAERTTTINARLVAEIKTGVQSVDPVRVVIEDKRRRNIQIRRNVVAWLGDTAPVNE